MVSPYSAPLVVRLRKKARVHLYRNGLPEFTAGVENIIVAKKNPVAENTQHSAVLQSLCCVPYLRFSNLFLSHQKSLNVQLDFLISINRLALESSWFTLSKYFSSASF